MKVHSFYIEEAEKHGVEKAVILYNLRFWLEKNKANSSNEHDGYYWTYNSAKAFSDLFPYFKERKINRLLNQLEEDGQILSGCFNKKGYDRTKWYSMPEFAVNNSNISTVALDDTPLVNSDKWISQNCQMDMSILTDALVNSDRPIPDSKPDTKPNSKPDVKSAPKTKAKNKVEKPTDVSSQVWSDFLELRKTKKAPLSVTAWNQAKKQVDQAMDKTGHSLEQVMTEWVLAGWTGFKCEWYLNRVGAKPQINRETDKLAVNNQWRQGESNIVEANTSIEDMFGGA